MAAALTRRYPARVTGGPPAAGALFRARRDHTALLTRLSRAQRLWDDAREQDRRGAALLAARLTRCADDIADHLADEERSVYPLLRSRLPPETGTLEAALYEHATLRDLLAVLRDRCADVAAGRADAAPVVGAVLRDLLALWRLHARRIDRAVAPLLRRLDREPRRD
jgi:hemerythrin-like domain-containing protein